MNEAGTSFSVFELILHSSFGVQVIMLILLISSILSWKVIFEYLNKIKKAEKEMLSFKRELSGNIILKIYPKLNEEFLRKKELFGIYRLFSKSFDVMDKNSSLLKGDTLWDKTYELEVLELYKETFEIELEKTEYFYKNKLSILGTVSSSAPYIGLLGTVYGILIAFWNLGAAQQATIATVAPSIAEALIATGMGLFVAIPSLIFYNRLNHRADTLIDDYFKILNVSSTLLKKHIIMSKTSVNDKVNR